LKEFPYNFALYALVLPCDNSHIITTFVWTILGGVIALFDLDYCTQNSLIVIHSTF